MEPITYTWLAVGLAPYHVAKRYPSRHVRAITIRAFFWTLDIRTCWQRRCYRHRVRWLRRTAWTLRIPLIERLRDAVWAAVMRLRGADWEEPQP